MLRVREEMGAEAEKKNFYILFLTSQHCVIDTMGQET